MAIPTQVSFKVYLFILAISLILIGLFFSIKRTKTFKSITATKLNKMISKPLSDMLIIDVRIPEEYRKGYIPRSINIPIQILKEQLHNKDINKNIKVIVYCQDNFRSRNAAQMLDDLGFTNVYCFGGIKEYPYSLMK